MIAPDGQAGIVRRDGSASSGAVTTWIRIASPGATSSSARCHHDRVADHERPGQGMKRGSSQPRAITSGPMPGHVAHRQAHQRAFLRIDHGELLIFIGGHRPDVGRRLYF